MSDSVNPLRSHQSSLREDHDGSGAEALGDGLNEVLGEFVDTTHSNTLVLADLSRDIRDGLATIIGYSDMLIEEMSREHGTELERIHGAGRRLLDTVRELENVVVNERDQRRIAEVLRAIVTLGATSDDLEQFATELFDKVALLIDYSVAQLWITDGASHKLLAEHPTDGDPRNETLSASRLDLLRTHLLSNSSARQDQKPYHLEEIAALDFYHPPIRHWLCVPLADQETGEAKGFLVFGTRQRNPFDTRSIDVAKRIGKHVSTTVVRLQRFSRMQTQAATDPLTGVANRRHFFNQARTALARARLSAIPATLLLLDIDYFKELNDTHGHLAGDQVLEALAVTLGDHLRGNDLLGRYGGEEFIVLLPGTELEPYGIEVADRLRNAVENLEVEVDSGALLSCTVSIGVAAMEADDDLVSLIGAADKALYEAKQQGRNQIKIRF